MEYSVNTRPLLQKSDSDSEDDYGERTERVPRNGRGADCPEDSSVVVNSDIKPLFKSHEPVDRYHFAYIIFYLLGMTTLVPWNFFITAEEYWMYKFRDVHNHTDPNTKTPLQVTITSYLSVATSVPNTLFLILNTFLSRRIRLEIRMLGSLTIMLILFIETTILVKVNTDSWQEEFFTITLVTVVILNTASAILTGGLLGIVGKFSPAYITAVVSGQALGGIFAAIAEILSLTFGVSALYSAFVYFMVGNVTLVLSLIAYILLAKSVFFKYHTVDKAAITDFEATTSCVVYGTTSYKAILKKIWLYGFSVWMVFTVTLSVYPSVTVLVQSNNFAHGNLWNDVYFVPVVSYLIFSTGDYLGRIFAGIFQWPMNNGCLVAVLNIARIIFIPLILFCNIVPREYLPTLITGDTYYITIITFFALTNGYLANIALIGAPANVEPHERETASSLMAAFLGVGLACGSALSLVMVEIL